MSRFAPSTQERVDTVLRSAILMLAGMYSVLLLTELPSRLAMTVAAASLLLPAGVARLRWAALPVIGFCLLIADVRSGVAQQLDRQLEGVDLDLTVRLVDFPSRHGTVSRLLVAPVSRRDLPPRIRLSWYDAESLATLGDCLDVSVRLRRPRGLSNPGGFDYEGWLFRQGIGATGYIRSGALADRCPSAGMQDRLRKQIAQRLQGLLPDDKAAAVILAIGIGARHRITAEDWQRYASTGTSHLMAISGMHIGLAAGAAYALAWVVLGLCRSRGNLRLKAAVVAMLAAAGYAAVSGFAVPARRALTMLLLAGFAAGLRRRLSPPRILGLTLLSVAGIAPRDVLSPGFLLSFSAVAVLLLLATGRVNPIRGVFASPLAGIVRLAELQIALLLGLLPLTGLLFDRASWLAPGVNLLVLPLFNALVVPATLAGMALTGVLRPLGDKVLTVAWRSAELILDVVSRAASLPGADLQLPAAGGPAAIVIGLTLLWILLPKGWPGRRIAWVAAMGAVLNTPDRPPEGCVDMHTLDVGQGLAVAVVSARHVVVFDAGPAYRSGLNTADLVITPFLRSLSLRRIDLLVVSHADLDHAGGARSLHRDWPVHATLVGEPLKNLDAPQFRCTAGQVWSWGGVHYRVIHPGENPGEGNNASCVLEIRSGQYRALLTGDIEARIERRLLRNALLSPAALVVIPHHGSATSSVGPFIDALAPSVALASAGFGNRWNMPRPEVVARWRATGAEVYDTARGGALGFRMCAATGVHRLYRSRPERRRVWHIG